MYRKLKMKHLLIKILIYSTSLIILIFLVGIVLSYIDSRFPIGKSFRLLEQSMAPTIMPMEYITISTENNDILQRKDIIAYYSPINERILNVKRLIGLPGDTVLFKNNHVFINHNQLIEPYIIGSTNYEPKVFGEIINLDGVVPNNQYLLLGDNRELSIDSRSFGYLEKKDIYGKVKKKVIVNYFRKILLPIRVKLDSLLK